MCFDIGFDGGILFKRRCIMLYQRLSAKRSKLL